MADVLSVACELDRLHKDDHDGKRMDKLRMNKLLYFLLRESLIQKMANKNFKLLFQASFQCWKLGPVQPEVYKQYQEEEPFGSVKCKLSDEEMELIKSVYDQYYYVSSWDLNQMTQKEFSWRYAKEKGEKMGKKNFEIPLDFIKVDAIHERLLREEKEKGL